jgi:hypothetical protein
MISWGSAKSRSIVLLLSAALCLAAAATPAAAVEDPAAPMYQPGTVDAIELTLPQKSVEALEAEPDEYQPGTLTFTETDGTPGGATGAPVGPLKVEIHLKGTTSFRPLTGKVALKIKFNKAERLLGLKKMTLNNMVQDPSMIHETLAYAAFRAAGVPAPRTGFAYLYVNGEDFGLHLNVETPDDLALEKRFGSFDKKTQHLYEGENGTDLEVGSAGEFEVDEGEEGNIADLEALIAAVNSTGPPELSARVAPFADLREMTTMWAVEKYVGQWDGYSGQEGGHQPNNYFLYSDPVGRFLMLPWGTDETWQEGRHLSFDGKAGLMFNLCLEDASCASTYRESLAAARSAIGAAGLDPLAEELATLLAPWQQMEQGNVRHEFTLQEIQEGVGETRAFIAPRPAEADEWLAAHRPPGPTAPESAPSPAGHGPPVQSQVLQVGRAQKSGRFLRTELHLLAPGVVSQQAQIVSRDGTIPVCRRPAQALPAGPVTLSCPLAAAALTRLRARWLRITLVTRVVSSDGRVEVISRRIALPRSR